MEMSCFAMLINNCSVFKEVRETCRVIAHGSPLLPKLR